MTEQNEIVLYRPDETLSLDVRVAEDTVWLNRQQMAELFGRDVKTIGKHINNALKEELAVGANFATTPSATGANFATVQRQMPSVAKFATVQMEGDRQVVRDIEYYSLDVVTSVGYRVKSSQGIAFRRWANMVLKQYMLHGVAIHPSLQQVEYHVTKRLEEQNERLRKIESRQDEQQQQLDFFIRTSTPPAEMVFMHGEFFTARVALEKLIKTAQKRAIIIDSYVDAETFEMLDVRAEGVEAVIYTGGVGKGLTKVRDLHNAQSGREPIEIYKWRVESHDRWLIVDDILYHCGPSVKDAGRKIGAISRMGIAPEVILNEMR